MRWSFGLLAVSMLLASCASSSGAPAAPGPSGRSTPRVVTATHGPVRSEGLAVLTKRAPCPPPARAPRASRAQLREFPAVAAVTCTWDERTYPHAGRWTVLVRKASGTGIGTLVAALDQPDQPRTGACIDVAIVGAPLALVDAKGNYLIPRYPRDGCGQAQSQAVQAVSAHPWQTMSVRKLKQQQTAREIAAHCGAQGKDMLAFDAAGQNLSPGEPVLNRHPNLSLHSCIYRASPNALEIGNFVRGVTLTEAQSATMRDALSRAGPTTACPPQRRFAYVSTPIFDSAGDADWVIVELGGCWRVYFDEWPAHDGQWRTLIGTADPNVVRNLLHAGP